MDQSFGGDLSQFQAIIEKYETLFGELTHELHSVKSEHDRVKSKLSALVMENQELSKDLSKFQAPGNVKSSSENDELTVCLKKQIKHLVLEKEHIWQLWQTAAKSVEILEAELRIFQNGDERKLFYEEDFLKLKQDYEDRLKDLENKLHVAENKIEKPSEDNVRKNIKNPTIRSINSTLENHAVALKIVNNLEDEVLILQKRLQESERTVAKFQRIIKEKDDFITNITRTNQEYREKVKEAVQVVQAALNEKDAALYREREAKDEIEKVSQELAAIIKETEEKVKNEASKLKMEYEKKQEILQVELKKSENEIAVKNLEIEKHSTKCSLLENEMDRFRKGNITMDDMHTSKLLVLEKNLESTFQKLLLSEKSNIQLVSEKETIKNDMTQMAEEYERNLKTRDIEKLTLKNKIKQFQTELEETKFNLNIIKDQLEGEREEKKKMENDWLRKMEEQEKSLFKSFTEKMAETTAVYDEKIEHFKAQLETKDQLNKKWCVETKVIVESLENLIAHLKKELSKSKKENKRLRVELEDQRKKFDHLKGFLQVITDDVDKMSLMAQKDAENFL